MLAEALWVFFFELRSEGHPLNMARTAALNVVVIVEIEKWLRRARGVNALREREA